MDKGCAYGHVLDQKVIDLKENVKNGFSGVEKKLDTINTTQTELFNHMSNRMTKGSVTVWCSLIGAICMLFGILVTVIISN